MVEVAKELVEPVHRGQVFVTVAEVVLAELTGAVALGLEQLGDGGILRPVAQVGAGQSHLAQAGAVHALATDEGGAAGGAALLGVIVDELGAFLGHPVDVGGLVPHQALAVAAQIALADVIAPENQDVGLAVGHWCLRITFTIQCQATCQIWLHRDGSRCVLNQRISSTSAPARLRRRTSGTESSTVISR